MAQAVGAGLPDFITVATAADGKLMTKVFFVDRDGEEQTLSYDKGYLFNFFTRPAACLDDLVRVLDGLDRHSCVIYGRLIEGISMPCRRLLNADQKTGHPATIEDAAHSWVLLDIDKLASRASFSTRWPNQGARPNMLGTNCHQSSTMRAAFGG